MRAVTLFFRIIIGNYKIIKNYEFRYDSHVIGKTEFDIQMTDSYYEHTIGRKLPFEEVETDEHLLRYLSSTVCPKRRDWIS